jgi:cytochrome c peroxidase
MLTAVAAAVLVVVAAADASAQPRSRAEVRAEVEAMTALGQKMFLDPALSGSGKLACASCHSPERAFGPPNGLAAQLGGGDMRQPGLRAVPSLRYLQVAPPFTEHFFDSPDDADESVDGGPTGGLTWDGRADRGSQQALIPLFSPFEMANEDSKSLAKSFLAAGYGPALAKVYGEAVLEDDQKIVQGIVKAFEDYEQDWQTFYPYSSKYDAYLAGTAELTPQEQRGLELFEDPTKGNCAECHISQRGFDGTPPQFSDFGLIALGLPRNQEIAANADPNWYDLGLCGPLRLDFKDRPEYCGLFRTATLRNAATRTVFFHNGVFHTLRDAVQFYVLRDTQPERIYPKGPDGKVQKLNDLPPQYWENLNIDPPLDRHEGDPPALNDAEIDDVVAFIGTLTDGWAPAD